MPDGTCPDCLALDLDDRHFLPDCGCPCHGVTHPVPEAAAEAGE